MTANPEPYDLTPADAAEILGVHRDTVQAWSDKGRLPVWWTPGGQRRYRRSDILALVSADRAPGKRAEEGPSAAARSGSEHPSAAHRHEAQAK